MLLLNKIKLLPVPDTLDCYWCGDKAAGKAAGNIDYANGWYTTIGVCFYHYFLNELEVDFGMKTPPDYWFESYWNKKYKDLWKYAQG